MSATATPALTDRAKSIARGLVVSGRATRRFGASDGGEFVRLTRRAGGNYWLAVDGAGLLSGDTIVDAQPLQPGFVAAMERAGAA
jgi:hypothetical protein